MCTQLLLGVLLVEVMGARLVRSDGDLSRIKTFAKAGVCGCLSYAALVLAALCFNNHELLAAVSTVSGFMTLYAVATLTALYFLAQLRLRCDQQLYMLAVAVGLCSFGYYVF